MKLTQFLCFALFTIGVNAQTLNDYTNDVVADLTQFSENYINPGMKGLLYGMNGSWYTTAKTHNKFGVDVTIAGNFAFGSDSDKSFNFNSNNYNFTTIPSGQTNVPTLISENDNETLLRVEIPLNFTLPAGTYDLNGFPLNLSESIPINESLVLDGVEFPGGIGGDLPMGALPSPMIQVGVGLPTSTDLKIRYAPKIQNDDFSGDLIGLGLQHNISQYFTKSEESTLPLNVSLLGAFTTMNLSYNMVDEDFDDPIDFRNANAEFKLNAWTVQAIGSLDYKLVSVYAGIGYNSGTTNLKLNGDFDLKYEIDSSQTVEVQPGVDLPLIDVLREVPGVDVNSNDEVVVTVQDPIDSEFEANGMRTTIGARLNLGFFKIFADYTFQEYNTASAGIVFSFN